MQIIQDLRWDDLRVAMALLRGGSLTAAARTLHVNISTVSRRLDALEATLGRHLFDRTPDGTRPTAVMEQLAPFAERMEQAAHGLVRGLEGLEAQPEGKVILAAPPGLVDHFLAPRLTELFARHPKLRIEILSAIGYADLTRREADLALRARRPASGDLVATRVGAHPYVVLGAADPPPARLRDPARAAWTTWGPDLAMAADARWLAAAVPRDRVLLATSSMTAQIEAVRSGLVYMIAPAPYATLPGLAEVPLSRPLRASLDELPMGSLWLVGHRALRDVPRIAATWDFLVEAFDQPPARGSRGPDCGKDEE
ncbi:MAG: LysR family transcriptional regulator [Polyangiaceae bacterium]